MMLSELARRHTEKAINTLVRMMEHSQSDQVRVQAACALLDRGYGKPPAQLDVAAQSRVEVVYRNEEEFRQALIERGFPAGLLPPPLTAATAEVDDESQE